MITYTLHLFPLTANIRRALCVCVCVCVCVCLPAIGYHFDVKNEHFYPKFQFQERSVFEISTPLDRRTHYAETFAASCPLTRRNEPEVRRPQETEDQNGTQGIRPDDWRTDEHGLRNFLETKPWFCFSEHFQSTYLLREWGHTCL